MLELQALVWALYLPLYPTAVCEDDPLRRLDVDSSLPYHPDVLAVGSGMPTCAPVWWAECGSVSIPKLTRLAVAHPSTQFTVAKWARSDLRGYAGSLCQSLPAGSIGRFEVTFNVLHFCQSAHAPVRHCEEAGGAYTRAICASHTARLTSACFMSSGD